MLVGGVAGALLAAAALAEKLDQSKVCNTVLNLAVVDVVPGYAPYQDFCRRNPPSCDLSGPAVARFNQAVERRMQLVNKAVNREIEFTLDRDQYGLEEYWNYPRSGRGDCEDVALEKRARLVRRGIPRGALRLAIVYHRQLLSAHCVLTLETDAGTYVLDSFSDRAALWCESCYNFEARERADGRWERYDQGAWVFDCPDSPG